jgi:GR25 family glycosyltransferase involved in LPS biosynthesis
LQIYVVNLDRSPERLSEFCNVNRNLSATVSRYPAIDGRALDLDALVRQGLATKDIVSPDMFSIGALGCAMSNIALWDKAIGSGQSLTVCEDDAIFNDRFGPCAQGVLKTLPPDWDIIFWGFNFDMFLSFELLPGVSHATTMFDQDRMRANVEAFQKQVITPQAFRLLWAFGTCCYSISPKGAATLKKKILPLAPRVTPFPEGANAYPYSPAWRHVGIDNAINAVHREINSFVCFPPLVVSKNELASSTVQTHKPVGSIVANTSRSHEERVDSHKDLIIVRAGKRSVHNTWLDPSAARTWELLICPYEDIPAQQGDGLLVSDVIAGSKWSALKILLEEWQGWGDYRYVLLADDDLIASQETWSQFFERCARYGSRLAQPALMSGFHFSHGLTVQNTEFVARRVSYVEFMMPCFRADVLAQLQETLSLSESGWGLGFLWAKRLEYKDIFVIDETPVLHTRPLHAMYQNKIPAYRSELARIMCEHHAPLLLKTYSGFLADGTEISENDGSFLHRLFHGYQRVFETDPKRFEEMIRLQLGVGDHHAEYPRKHYLGKAPQPARASAGAPKTTAETFLDLAPFLRATDSPKERRGRSRAFDARIEHFLDHTGSAALPQIHCFYEVLSGTAEHRILIAATASMRAAGHPVRVWSYSPQKLEFLRPHGVELRSAEDVIPKNLFERVVQASGIRYFSDMFRYAVLYEFGGLWMDSDVILLRSFPFHGDHFFNLQWRSGHENADFVCGNVMYAAPFSRHMRTLYETAIERFFGSRSSEWGMVGPKLLSDYIASDAGAELQDRVFGPMFFNSIDWTEIDRFNKPLVELKDYLNDARVFGIHLWTALNAIRPSGEGAPLISLLTDPLANFPSLTSLADRFNTDKNRHTGNSHCYARIYDQLLSDRRLSMRRLMEIGLCRGLEERNQPETPSVALWQSYFPFCHVIGIDLTDFSRFNSERFTSFVCDQSRRDDLRAAAERLEPGSIDVIIDDGSHASFDQQLTLCEFWPLLADGGWYFIEDLDWQPRGEDPSKITLSKMLLRELKDCGVACSPDPLGLTDLAGEFAEILFFDSHFELNRAKLLGGLVAIRKRGGSGLVR